MLNVCSEFLFLFILGIQNSPPVRSQLRFQAGFLFGIMIPKFPACPKSKLKISGHDFIWNYDAKIPRLSEVKIKLQLLAAT